MDLDFTKIKKNDEFVIYFEDTDAQGVVYHAKYLHFLERARTNWFANSNISQLNLFKQNIFFVVKNIDINFIKSVQFQDKIRVESSIQEIKRCSIIFLQEIFIQDKKAISSVVKVVCTMKVEDRFKPIAIPSFIIEKLLN